MNIKVVPRKFFEDIKGTDREVELVSSCNIISINTPIYTPKDIVREQPPFTNLFDNILVLYFHDWTYYLPDVVLFDNDHVDQICNFINNFDTSKGLIIHCTAGISRSGSIGDILNQYFNANNVIDYDKFKLEHKHIRPNVLVYNLLKDQLIV